MKILKLFFTLTMLVSLISGCSDDPLFTPEDTGTETGTGIGIGIGIGTDFSNIALRSHIPVEIPYTNPDTLIKQEAHVLGKFFMGNSASQALYVLFGAGDRRVDIYRADNDGQTELYGDDFRLNNKAISGDNTLMVTMGKGLRVIDIASTEIRQIGSSFGSFYLSIRDLTITDDGSLVAFIDNSDLTGDNPGSFWQIFTLTTDGSDVLTQLSSFTENYFSSQDFQHAFAGNGSTIFFHNKADILNDGSNADGSDEIFSINVNGSNLTQLTTLDLTADTEIVEIKTDSNGANVTFLGYLSQERPVRRMESILYSLNTTTKAVTPIDTLSWSADFYIGPTILQHDLSADGSTIFYTTRNVISADPFEVEKFIYSVNTDGTNKQQLFTTGLTTNRDPTNNVILSPEASSDGSTVSFLSDFNFGATVEGEHTTQIYTLRR